MSEPSKFRVAICGGGISGLTLALVLTQYKDIEVDIYEGASRFEEIGAGIGIWGRGLTVLKKMGFEEKLRKMAGAPPGKTDNPINLRRSDQLNGGEVIGELVLQIMLGLHRAHLLDFLVARLSDAGHTRTHFSKRCVSFTQTAETETSVAPEPVVMHFADGTCASCDILIGCDGIKSSVRKELMMKASEEDHADVNLGRFAPAGFSGTVAYRALVKQEDVKAVNEHHEALTGQVVYCGTNKHIVCFPVGGGLVSVSGYASDPTKREEWSKEPWTAQAGRLEFLELFRDFEPDAQAILNCVNESLRLALYDVGPLPFWSKGFVAILGDAAHAMPPYLGAGGGQALEDAYVLGNLLGSPTAKRGTLPAVLRAYEQVRSPIANTALLNTREARRAYQFQEEYGDATNERVLEDLHRLAAFLWEGTGDPDSDVQAAEKLVLEGTGGKYKA